jgi:hypothetical protein
MYLLLLTLLSSSSDLIVVASWGGEGTTDAPISWDTIRAKFMRGVSPLQDLRSSASVYVFVGWC